jgi:hypothetical protein
MIIGIGFKKQSGKDEFFKIAARRFPHVKIIRHAFADELKIYVWESFLRPFGISMNHYNDPEFYIKIRPVIQSVGMFLRDLAGPDYWINKVSEKIRSDSINIITDVRLRNERDWVKSQGGTMIRINRKTELHDSHISENDLDDDSYFDIVIDNYGTLYEYEEKVVKILSEILGTPQRNINTHIEV